MSRAVASSAVRLTVAPPLRPLPIGMIAAWRITCPTSERVALSTGTVREAITHDFKQCSRYGLLLKHATGDGTHHATSPLLTTDGAADAIRSM